MKRILIVDDERKVRGIYMRLFRSFGIDYFDVDNAATAEDALEKMIRSRTDLILLDIKMPEVNGQEFYWIIKEYNPSIKILVTSVYPVAKQKQLVPYADGYYDKSQGPLQLIEKVEKMLAEEISLV